MEANSIMAYSPEIIYGQLTSPFVPKTISINSHTQYDAINEDDTASGVFSRKSFQTKIFPKMKIEINMDESEEKTLPLAVKNVTKENNASLQSLNNKNEQYASSQKLEISSFSISKLSSKDIVNSSLKLGYSADEAVVIDNARKAYEKSLLITDNPAETLSSCSYSVH